jgi:TonB family protein
MPMFANLTFTRRRRDHINWLEEQALPPRRRLPHIGFRICPLGLCIQLLMQTFCAGQTAPPGAEVRASAATEKFEPAYSNAAIKARSEDTVVLSVVVEKDGAPTNIRVIRSLGPSLDEMAIGAARTWRFRPGFKNGKAVPARATIEVNFRQGAPSRDQVSGGPDELGSTCIGPRVDVTTGTGVIAGPTAGKQQYSVNKINIPKFQFGGTLMVEVSVGDGKPDASFDLLSSGVYLQGPPSGQASLAFAHNVPSNGAATIKYRFEHGGVVILGAEGSWPPAGKSPNMYKYSARACEDILALLLAGSALSAASAGELETRLRDNPNDLPARSKLISYYTRPPDDSDAAALKAGRSRHILWLIEHLPGTPLLGYKHLCAFNTEAGLLPDIEAYEKGKQLWKAQLTRFPGYLSVMENAVNYFEINDPEEAELLVLEMVQKEPKYLSRLGEVYGHAILGATAVDYQTGKETLWASQSSHSAFANRALETVRASSNRSLLAAAGSLFAGYNPRIWDSGRSLGLQVYRVGDGVTAPVPLYRPEPEYSEEARKAKYQGTVVVSFEVDSNGIPHHFKILRSLGLGLDEKAIEAVEKWKFRPGYKDGRAVTVAASIEVNFKLL